MQKKDSVLVEFSTFVLTCQICGTELHLKDVKNVGEAIDRAYNNGWRVMDTEICRECEDKRGESHNWDDD